MHYFPTEFLGLAMGFSNVIGRLSTIAAPIIAEQSAPLPMSCVITLAVMGIVSSLMLQKPESLMTEEEQHEVELKKQDAKVREIFN